MVIETDPVGGGGTRDTDGDTDSGSSGTRSGRDPQDRIPDYYERQIEAREGGDGDQQDTDDQTSTPIDRDNLQQRQNRPTAVPDDQTAADQADQVTDAGVEEESGQIGQQAREFESQITERPGVGTEDVRIEQTERDGQQMLTAEYTDQYRRERAAQSATAAVASRPFTDAGEVRVGDLQQRQNRPTATPLRNRVEADEIELSDDGAELTEQEQREQAAQQFQRRGVDVTAADVTVTDGSAELSEAAQERLAAERVAERTGLAAGEDFTVDVGEGGVSVETTQAYREEQVASALDLPESIIEEGEDYTRPARATDAMAPGAARAVESVGGDQLRLSPDTRRLATEARIIDQGYVEVDRPGAEIPAIGGTVGGGTERIEIEDPNEQLQFDEQGRLTGVSQPEYTQEDIEANERQLAENIGFGPVGEGIAAGFGYTAKGTDVVADVSTDVGAALQEEVIDPVAELSGDIQSAQAEAVDVINPLSSEFASEEGVRQFSAAAGDIARGESDEVSRETFIEGATEKVGRGALAPIRFGAELPATVQTGALVGADAAGFAAESITEEGFVGGTIESGAAAGSAAVELGETVAVQTIQNPFATAGTLAGSAAIMGGAAAVGPRAGLATRAAIQPGEELLGYGGYGLTRRVAGQRAADTAFPRQEPLIFSEEAAIMAGRRVGRGVRNVGGRIGERVGGIDRPSVPFASRVEIVRAPDDPFVTYGYQGRSALNVAGERAGRRIASRFAESDISASNIGERVGRRVGGQASELPGEIGQSIRQFGRQAQSLRYDIPDRVQTRGEAFGRGVGQRATEVAGEIGQSIRQFGMGADVLRYDIPDRIQTRGETFGRGVGERATEVPGQVSGALRGAELSVEATGVRLQEGGERLGGRVGQRATEVPGEIGQSIRRFGMEADVLRYDIPDRIQTRGETFGRGVGESATELPGQVSGALRGAELTPEAAAFRLQESSEAFGRGVGERGRGLGERIGDFATRETSLTDYSIRIRPRMTTIEVETRGDVTPSVRTETGQQPFELPGDFDQPDTGSQGMPALATEGGTETGVAVQRVIEAPRIETESPGMESVGRTPLRTEFGSEEMSTPTVDIGEVQEPTLGADISPIEGVETGTRIRPELSEEIRTGIEGRQETETETETEPRRELFQEVETETESEVETEFELEMETETRREFERDRDTDPDERRPMAPFGEDVGQLFADFRDPLTGELLETERDNIGIGDI